MTARVRSLVILALWSVPAWLMVLQMTATAFVNRTPPASWRSFVPALLEWYLWVPLTPAVVCLTRRFELAWPARPSVIGAHALAVVIASALRGVVYGASTWYVAGVHPAATLAPFIGRLTLGWLPVAVVVYGAIVAGAMALDHARRSRNDRLHAAELEARLAAAERDLLQAHLDPHFLFNALHSVAALVRTRERTAAVEGLATLSELLREVLRRPAPELVPLDDELGFARRYLSLAELRFQDQLEVEWQIDDSTRALLVPRLVLHPLVENAVAHGIARLDGPGRIAIDARRAGDRLLVRVADSGPGGTADRGEERPAIGLAGVRARLERSFRREADLSLETGPAGTVATIAFPVRHG
jgi:hypothetical protein